MNQKTSREIEENTLILERAMLRARLNTRNEELAASKQQVETLTQEIQQIKNANAVMFDGVTQELRKQLAAYEHRAKVAERALTIVCEWKARNDIDAGGLWTEINHFKTEAERQLTEGDR
jgi:uncharacterized membrane-anchored protein YhcB (DUF1043 family)